MSPQMGVDEPKTGLDPHQIHHMREGIKALRQEKAILLSTHIMQEVAAICDHVIILYKGGGIEAIRGIKISKAFGSCFYAGY